MSAKILSRGESSERLAERRKKRRRRILLTLALLVAALCGAMLYGLWQPPVRISRIDVSGATDQSLAEVARAALRGTYHGLVPRDSIFFFPDHDVRARILEMHPDIAAISISRTGFSSISIMVHERTAVARWCGLAPTPGVEAYCYVFDPGGFIFAAAASTTSTLNPFTVYAPLVGDTLEPLRATVAHAENLPTVFDFARELGALDTPVVAVVMRGDEVDDLLATGARVTYILGSEQDAYTALVSARATFNLTDPTLEYVDLRFPGKVYLKRTGVAPATTPSVSP